LVVAAVGQSEGGGGSVGRGYNLGDLASNLGFGRPLARVISWAKKVGSMKSVLEEINEHFTCSRCKGTAPQRDFLMIWCQTAHDFFYVKMKCRVPT
jgi:hypothetical protein